MNADSLTFSLILCTFERTADLLATLDSIRRTHVPDGMTGELIVVDSSRTEDTRRALHQAEPIPRLPLRVLHEPRRGKAHALNTGIAAARGIALLFTDDDVRVPSAWVGPMVQPILDGHADAIAGGIHLASDLRRPWMDELHRGWMASTDVLDQEKPAVLTGANMAFGRHVLAKVPVFDPELGAGSALGGGDETLFSFQLLAAGFRLLPAFTTSVEHHFDPARLSRRSFLDRTKIEGRSNAYIAHHWEHKTIAHPRLELMLLWGKLWIKRWHERARWSPSEGLPTRELHRRTLLHFRQQYLVERRRQRNYAKHGLVKLTPVNLPNPESPPVPSRSSTP